MDDVPVPVVRPEEVGVARAEEIPAPAQVATGEEILAGLLRTWNRMVGPNASSKVLFEVWPEEIDGQLPDAQAIEKRRRRTAFDRSEVVAVE